MEAHRSHRGNGTQGGQMLSYPVMRALFPLNRKINPCSLEYVKHYREFYSYNQNPHFSSHRWPYLIRVRDVNDTAMAQDIFPRDINCT